MQSLGDHFVDVNKMLILGSVAGEIEYCQLPFEIYKRKN